MAVDLLNILVYLQEEIVFYVLLLTFLNIVEISCYFLNTYSGKINTANIARVNVLVRTFQIQRMYVECRMDNDGKKILF